MAKAGFRDLFKCQKWLKKAEKHLRFAADKCRKEYGPRFTAMAKCCTNLLREVNKSVGVEQSKPQASRWKEVNEDDNRQLINERSVSNEQLDDDYDDDDYDKEDDYYRTSDEEQDYD